MTLTSYLKSICVYCGSAVGNNPLYTSIAVSLADYIVGNGMRLVNGGGGIGLMGVMADRVIELGGECIGVIPLGLKEREVAHPGMTELIVTPDMHTRKRKMIDYSDAFIAIPGGFGTLDELFETLTWAQLNIHHKPIGLLNVNGYFDPLLEMANHMVAEGFLKVNGRALLHSARSIEDLFELFRQHAPDYSIKWK